MTRGLALFSTLTPLRSPHTVSPQRARYCRFVFANTTFFRLLNYVPRDLIGMSLLNLCHPADCGVVNDTIQVLALTCAHNHVTRAQEK